MKCNTFAVAIILGLVAVAGADIHASEQETPSPRLVVAFLGLDDRTADPELEYWRQGAIPFRGQAAMALSPLFSRVCGGRGHDASGGFN